MENYVKNPKLEENNGFIGKKCTEHYCKGFEFQAMTAYSLWVKVLSLVCHFRRLFNAAFMLSDRGPV